VRQSVGVKEGGILDHRDAGDGGREGGTEEEGAAGKGRPGTAKTGSTGAVTERFFSSSATAAAARHDKSSSRSLVCVESSLAERGGESDSEKKGASTTL